VHILVIDDHALLAKVLGDILTREGHRVAVENGGRAGLDAFHAARAGGDPFTLVITDFSMADVDGLQVAAGVKAVSASTGVMLLTAYRTEAGDERPPHIDCLLSKPPALKALREALSRFDSSEPS
jgi:CheY-like chemotaxis protein